MDYNLIAKIVQERSIDNITIDSKVNDLLPPHMKKVYSNIELAKFTPKQLMDELRSRGYSGELKYVQTIKI